MHTYITPCSQKRVVNGEYVNNLSDISRSKSVLRERLEYDILLVLKACCAKGNLYMYSPRSKRELEESLNTITVL